MYQEMKNSISLIKMPSGNPHHRMYRTDDRILGLEYKAEKLGGQ